MGKTMQERVDEACAGDDELLKARLMKELKVVLARLRRCSQDLRVFEATGHWPPDPD